MTGQVNYLVEAPELGQGYYVLHIQKDPFYSFYRWEDKDLEKRWLALHRVYPTKEDVVRAAEFVRNFYISHKEQLNYLTSEPEAGTKLWLDMNVMWSFGRPYIYFKYRDRDSFHQVLLETFQLYGTREDLIKDMNLIIEALEKEYKKAH